MLAITRSLLCYYDTARFGHALHDSCHSGWSLETLDSRTNTENQFPALNVTNEFLHILLGIVVVA